MPSRQMQLVTHLKDEGGEEKNANWRRGVNGGVGTARGEGGRKERRELSPPATGLT